VDLNEAIEHAAEHLPEGWRISVEVERGAGWVALWDECGIMDRARDELERDCETSLADTVEKAVKIAQRLHAEEYGISLQAAKNSGDGGEE